MTRILTTVSCLLLLSACGDSGMSLYLSKEKNNHYRTFARVTDAEDTERVHFEVRKRDREVIAERELFISDDGKRALCATGGRHKDKDWSGSLVMRWNF